MNITEKRYIPQDFYPFVKILQYDKSPIKLLGSAGLASQQYYSDYDMMSVVSGETSCKKAYNTISSIIERAENNPNMYFIEFKLQTKKGRKIREVPEDLSKFCQYFRDVEFIKLDYIVRIQSTFVELSIIYSFSRGEEDFKMSVKKDIRELYDEGKYYKVLKRIFSIVSKEKKNVERDNKLVLLTNFFNSDIGKIYQDASNLRAIKLLLDNYEDEDTRRKAELNLKDLKLKLSDIGKLERSYNREAKKVLEEL
jgi:hypothetical protein